MESKVRQVLIVFLFFVISCGTSNNKIRIIENDHGEQIAIGSCSEEQLLSNFPQFNKNYLSYQPDTTELADLKSLKKKVEIFTILGTWCSDSRREVPRFLKIMDYINNPNFKLSFLCVDRSKQDRDGITASYGIQYVPTFIVSYNGTEIGRIVEQPDQSLERDLSKMIRSIKSF